MGKFILAIALSTLSLSSFAAQTDCDDHYTKEGSFFSGRTFRAWREFPDVAPDVAFGKATQAIMRLGFTVTSSDKASGLISASHGVAGSPATVPLNTIVTAAGAGSRVELTFAPQGGVVMGEDRVRSGICDIFGTIAR